MFKKLYIKEMQDIKQELLVIIALALACNIGLLLWPNSIVGFLFLLSIMSSGIVPIISSVKSLSNDWNNNTIYLLKSLPVKGSMVLLAKIMALLSEFFIGTVAVFILMVLSSLIRVIIETPISFSEMWNQFITGIGAANSQMFFKVMFLVYIAVLAGFVYLVSMIILSQMIARIKGKYMRLISYISFISLAYIGGKVGGYIMSNLPWTQYLQFAPPEQIPANLISVFLSAIIIIILLSALMIIGAGTIYDKKVEL